MPQLDSDARTLDLKLVYYGPALSGKTTNLQALKRLAPSSMAGRLMTLETRDNRTLFMDLLPMVLRSETGFSVRLKVITVPGQIIHASTRAVLLENVDGVVFVADSQLDETEANKQAFNDLAENLRHQGISADVPLVFQFNKRDLANVRTEMELETFRRRRDIPLFRAVATRGIGVAETFRGLLEMVWLQLDDEYDLTVRLGAAPDQLLDRFFRDWLTPDAVESWG